MIFVLLDVARHRIRNYDQLIEDTGLHLSVIAPLVKKLEDGNLIFKNPNPTSNKFRLSFNGQLIVEQLKSEYPGVKKLLGEGSLIEPINRYLNSIKFLRRGG